MKWFRSGLLAVCLVAAIAYADLPPGSSGTVASSALESALFRMMGLPDGAVMHSRPPSEARRQVGVLLQKAPHDAELYSLRAREEELLQDYAAAEADWKSAASNSQDKAGAFTELAQFYGRRNQPKQQVEALLKLGALPQPKAFTQALEVADNAQLPAADHATVFDAWIQAFPKQEGPYRAFFAWEIGRKDLPAATALAARIRVAFPQDEEFALSNEASLAGLQSGAAAELQVYATRFSALWPDPLRTQYHEQLAAAHQLRVFLSAAQAQAAGEPGHLAPATRLFFYYEQQGRKDVADQQLLAFEARHGKAWTAEELKTIAALFLRTQDYDECANAFYQLYALPQVAADDKEFALAQLIGLLLDVPEKPLQFGRRDLSLYKNTARMDRHPGFLNGILTLALNSTFPEAQYQEASQNAVSYFHRATASRLLEELRRQFPASREIAPLESKLFNAYAAYGQNDAIVQYVPAWLERNPQSGLYVNTALVLADAYAAKTNTQAETAVYDSLLKKLADESGHMPTGLADYARVLDRYLSRLVQLERPLDAIALLRREIDRNPNDPGIYERLALFMEQNRLDAGLEQTYQKAFAQFHDASWASKLARFYLTRKRYSDYQTLTQKVTDTFKGSDVAPFLNGVRPNSQVLFRQVNLYAHQRFPHNVEFVRNLLVAYTNKQTYDANAYEQLLREYWFYDEGFRTQFFQMLSRQGKLREELSALPPMDRATSDGNLAALRFNAEGHAWLTEYEAAAPAFVRLAQLIPGDRDDNGRAIAIERSLGWSDEASFKTAVKLAQQDVNAAPADREAMTRVGEIYADHDLYSQARPWWNRVAAIQPGAAAGYLDSATVFWDYFQFNDALRMIAEARDKLHDAGEFSYEAGAIYENEGDPQRAVAEYINGALHGTPELAQSRLLQLAGRPATAAVVERETAKLVAGPFDAPGLELRLAVLEKLDRRPDIEAMLSHALQRASDGSEIATVRTAADRLGFDRISADAMQRTVGMTSDPIEKLQAELDLGHFFETHNDQAGAERIFSSVLAANPNRLGAVRAAVDFFWRSKQNTKAVETLMAAADGAKPPYETELRREAADKASSSGQYEIARKLLDQLLVSDPWNGDLLAAKALTYARQNDANGLIGFYATELAAMQHAALPAQEKATRIAGMRRGYIAALIKSGKDAEALEQYQLVMNSFPEDAGLIAEASRFAEEHQLSGKLVAYYSKAVADAPRDYRWPLVLARVETTLRHYPEAINAYDKAGVVRPDRADIFLAKADLQTRLLRFEDALNTDAKLYELSFHDNQYLVAEAGLQMRLNRPNEALKLLRAGFIDAHPSSPEGYVAVMRQEAAWNNYQAVDATFEELRGIAPHGSAWIVDAAVMEAQALTALHRPRDAVQIVADVLPKAASADAAANAIGLAAREYLTPEEKQDFATYLESGGVPKPFAAVDLAEKAGLANVQAELEFKAALKSRNANDDLGRMQQLQSRRLVYRELGRELEAIAQKRVNEPSYESTMRQAFSAYANAGDVDSELRLISYSDGEFASLFVRAGGDLDAREAELSKTDPSDANKVVERLLSDGSEEQIQQIVKARGQTAFTSWTDSYLALAGLYLDSPRPWVAQAFARTLGARTVGGELASLANEGPLRGEDWFYYAARFGEYLGYRKDSSAEDLLPASVEGNAAASDNYVQLAASDQDLKRNAGAAQVLREALQLSPDRADVYDRLAMLAMEDKQRAEAVELWRKAFHLLAARVEQGPLPNSYWQVASTALTHMNRFHLVAELQPAADEMLRAYGKRNGTYRIGEILSGLFAESTDPAVDVNWIVTLSQAPNLQALLAEVVDASYIPVEYRRPLFEAQLVSLAKQLQEATPEQAPTQREQLNAARVAYATYLQGQRRWPDEWAVLQQIEPARSRPGTPLLVAAAMTDRLDALLAGYRAAPDSTPFGEEFLNAAGVLEENQRHDAALMLKEFEYRRELDAGTASASAWFGMAEVRFEQKRNAEGLQLIRDVTLTVGEPFENLPEAVRVLEKAQLPADASKYAKEWKTAEPWNAEAGLALARLENDSGALNAVRTSANAPYRLRVAAAKLLGEQGSVFAGTDELALLTHQTVSAQQAAKPFYLEARLAAAKNASTNDRIRLYREAIAIDPDLQDTRLELAEAAFGAQQNTLGFAAFDTYGQTDVGQVSRLRRVQILAAKAAASEHNFERAVSLYTVAVRGMPASPERDSVQKALNAASDAARLQRANLARRPVVTDAVKQPGIVKPRLTAWDAHDESLGEQ